MYTQFQKVIPMDVSRRDGSVELLEYLKGRQMTEEMDVDDIGLGFM